MEATTQPRGDLDIPFLLPSPRHEGADCKLVKGDGSLESADPCLLQQILGDGDERNRILSNYYTFTNFTVPF